MLTSSPVRHRTRPRTPRRGRVLVECCVALVVLAGGSSLLLLLSTTTAHLVDAARQDDAVLTATGNAFAPLYAAPCTVGTATAYAQPGPRTVIARYTQAHDAMRTLRVHTWWQPAALAGARAHHHHVASAAVCE